MRKNNIEMANCLKITENDVPLYEREYLDIQNYHNVKIKNEMMKKVTFDLTKNRIHPLATKEKIEFGKIVDDIDDLKGEGIEIVIESNPETSPRDERKQNIEELCRLFNDERLQDVNQEGKKIDGIFPKIKDNPFVLRDKG
jgi:hypothetical protein